MVLNNLTEEDFIALATADPVAMGKLAFELYGVTSAGEVAVFLLPGCRSE